MNVASNIFATESEILKLGGDLESIKKDLTLPNPEYAAVRRFGKGKWYKKVEPNICYLRKVGDNYILPRYYFGEPTFGKDISKGRNLSCTFNIKLRDYQEEFCKQNPNILKKTGILFEAPCGSGKTLMAIWFSSLIGKQTLILVPTYYLAKQWKARLTETSDASVIILNSLDEAIPFDKDFTIVVMDLFSRRTFPESFIKNIGHVVLDEAHRVGAETYLPILDQLPAIHRTALTATFRRADGVHKVLAFHFGEHFKMESRFPRPSVYSIDTGVYIRNLVSKNRPYEKFLDFMDFLEVPYTETKSSIEFVNSLDILQSRLEGLYKSGRYNKSEYKDISSCLKKGSDIPYTTIDSYLNDHSGRRKLAIRVIQKCLDSGRTILFLSKRKDTLKSLHKYFAAYRPMLIISETSSLKPAEEEYLQKECRLIFGVTQLAKEGLDNDRLDTLIIHLPIKDTEQAIGRISRLRPDKKPPVAFYLLDNNPICWAVFRNAQKFMRINSDYKGGRTLFTLDEIL